MNREQAERLLAALIFDDLDETSKAELLAYLQTDDELRYRLADLRLAARLTSNAVNEGPDPVLGERRLKQLKRLAQADKARARVISMRPLLAAAAVLTVGLVLVALMVPSLGVRRATSWSGYSEAQFGDVRTGSDNLYKFSDSPGVPAAGRRSAREVPSDAADSRYSMAVPEVDVGARTIVPETEVGGVVRNSMGIGGSMGRGMGGMGGMGGVGMMGGMGGFGMGGMGGYDGTRAKGTGEVALKTPAFNGDIPADGGASSRRVATPGQPVVPPEQSSSIRRMNAPLGVIRRRVSPEELELQVAQDAYGKPIELKKELTEIPSAAGEIAKPGWSGYVTSQIPAVPMSAPAPLDRAVIPDKETAQARFMGSPAGAEKRVPKMGDIPVIGRLFRKDTSSVQENEIRDDRDNDELKSRNQPVEEYTADLLSSSGFRVVPVNPWVLTDRDALSTFALDVDTASYALCRRFIRGGFLPPLNIVRMEEFINAFDYAYPQRDDATFAVHAEGAPSPFAPAGQDMTLLKVAVKARTIGRDQRRAAHLIFVVDASASMGQPDRLPQVQAALNLLVDKLSDADRISLITCANEARLHLEAVSAREKEAIRETVDAIQPAGPTNLAAGLKLGYEMARGAFIAGQINQVVLCSDGVANVGQTEAEAVLNEVARDRKQGITLTCVGVGYGAYNDAFLEALADHGDGRYVFLDSSEPAREALVSQLAATLQTVARDARIQVQFNPARVRCYRLIGYENRDIADQRFRDDTVDAGAIGSGQCSTALYELELTSPSSGEGDADFGTVFVRYRNAKTGQVEEVSRPLTDSIVRRRSIEEDPRFFLAAGAARFAEWLRQSEHAQNTALADIQRLLDQVSVALPLDENVQDLAVLAHRAEGLPRAP